MVLPKLLRRIFARDALENLGAAWVLVYEICEGRVSKPGEGVKMGRWGRMG